MRKCISLVCLLSVWLTLFVGLPLPMTAWAETCGDFEYTMLEDGTVQITGYTGSEANLKIPEMLNGNKVTGIAELAFQGCVSLVDITIPEGIKSIEWGTFFECTSLASITLPSSLISFSVDAFSNCPLNSIYVSEKNEVYSDIEGVLFSKDKSELICYPRGKTEPSYSIPECVKKIETQAFSNCDSLTSIIVGDGVTSIGDYVISHCKNLSTITFGNNITSITAFAFSQCESLMYIEVSEENAIYSDIDGVLFSKDKSELIRYPIGRNDTSYCIPDNVIRIGKNAFYECTLISITLPDSLTQIGDSAFAFCGSLVRVTIPNNTTVIDDFAFRACRSLESITLSQNLTTIGWGAFSGCGSLTSIVLPNTVTSIEPHSFRNCESLTNVIIPDSVTKIGAEAFLDCNSLTSITIPGNVTTIGREAFGMCDSLENVTILDGVTSLGLGAFWLCQSLARIVIPDSVVIIMEYAFDDCDNVTIYGYADSYAQQYAVDNNVSFSLIENGELTGDGEIDANDALFLFKYINGMAMLNNVEFMAADISGDGKVNLFDAARLFYMVNGLI